MKKIIYKYEYFHIIKNEKNQAASMTSFYSS